MNEEAATKAVKNLQYQVDSVVKDGGNMTSASWDYAVGVLITGNEAKALIELWNFYQMYKPR